VRMHTGAGPCLEHGRERLGSAPSDGLRRGRLAVKGLLRMGCACAQDALNALMQVCAAWPWDACRG